jgi:hypothetical protein
MRPCFDLSCPAMLRRLVGPLLCLITACGGGGGGPDWQTLASGEKSSLLSIWGTSPSDVWVAGGRSELQGGPTILHLAGEKWSRVDSGQHGIDLWWVFGFEGGDVFFTGSGGAILRYHDGTFERMTTPRSGIIFGLWGAAPNDLWAVGKGDDDKGIVWRYDGATWHDADLPPMLPGIVLKVHGQRTDDVWISCADGVALHWDGTALTRIPTSVTSSLFSIVTTPDTVIAVGGYMGQGQIVENSGAGWTTQQPSLIPVAWRGVAAGAGVDQIFAVGESGAAAQRKAAGWSLLARPDQPVTQLNFHAAWVDSEGGLWGVGGMFDTLPLTSDGFLAYYGATTRSEVSP